MPSDSPQDDAQRRGPEREPTERRFALDELTSAAGVTPRTVRYYIAEGLLPPPLGAGPGNHYTQAHLDRLLLIGQLKEQYLPLKEIRRNLQQMTDEQVHDTIELTYGAETPAFRIAQSPSDAALTAALPDDDAPRAMSSAEDYIAGVLDTPTRARTAIRMGTAQSRGPDPAREPPRWRRVAITPEAELLIDEETWRRRREQIESVIAFARRVLE